MIKKLLIANRGEIACRIIRTARAMGIATVAVYSDADAQALHVSHADEAIHIGASPARESYLVPEKILAAAAASGADAVHPGYGFLSENAGFAQAVIDSGLVWVGPKPASIIAMGMKDAAKRLMQAAGVPTTPGYLGDDQSPVRLQTEANAIGYPVLIKAVAGGGGKGMRRVENAGDFGDALESCRREAAASFGEERVLIEKYILSPRHIEVQVFGDLHGNVVHLFERDCSLQRRHQKVIEEAPAPGMDAATRAALCATAVQAARAVDYVGAGTIEFIADASDGLRADRIWFMEMNTRLQVEHPVTEAITGVDLVEWQLRVASGELLPRRQDELAINGWAIEARLYAEDPAAGFLPSIGRLEVFDVGAAWRIDTGVRQGDTISPFYDPMIAKVIAHGVDREAARASLATTLGGLKIWPLLTNAGFLGMALNHADFAGGRLDTGLIAREGDALLPPAKPSRTALAEAAGALVRPGLMNGFRLNADAVHEASFLLNGVPVRLPIGEQAGGQDQLLVAEHGQMWALSRWRIADRGGDAAADGAILSPMPGRIIAVFVDEGEVVTKGQKLLTLEAMKMEHTLVAPFDGIVVALTAVAGGQAVAGAALANIDRRKS